MREDDFIAKNKDNWSRLERYNTHFTKKSITGADKSEIREFSSLYRTASHNLAYARTHFGESKTSLYLNQLVSVSHNQFYIKEKSGFSSVLRYFTTGFPDAVAAHRKIIFLSFAIFMASAVFCAVMTVSNPEFINYFFSEQEAASISLDPKEDNFYAKMGASIMTNNIRVSALSIAYGITAGIGTVYVIILNGGLLGALWGHILNSGASFFMPEFWALILPHGFIELFEIFVSGGMGLLIGKSILLPGDMSRKHSLIKSFKEAAYMLPGLIMMLIVAGLIEGFFTPLDLPRMFKIGFAVATLISLILYFRKSLIFKKAEIPDKTPRRQATS